MVHILTKVVMTSSMHAKIHKSGGLGVYTRMVQNTINFVMDINNIFQIK